jgi:hypothetical protein
VVPRRVHWEITKVELRSTHHLCWPTSTSISPFNPSTTRRSTRWSAKRLSGSAYGPSRRVDDPPGNGPGRRVLAAEVVSGGSCFRQPEVSSGSRVHGRRRQYNLAHRPTFSSACEPVRSAGAFQRKGSAGYRCSAGHRYPAPRHGKRCQDVPVASALLRLTRVLVVADLERHQARISGRTGFDELYIYKVGIVAEGPRVLGEACTVPTVSVP